MERVTCLVTVLALSVAVSPVYAQGNPQAGLALATRGLFRVPRGPKRAGFLTKLKRPPLSGSLRTST